MRSLSTNHKPHPNPQRSGGAFCWRVKQIVWGWLRANPPGAKKKGTAKMFSRSFLSMFQDHYAGAGANDQEAGFSFLDDALLMPDMGEGTVPGCTEKTTRKNSMSMGHSVPLAHWSVWTYTFTPSQVHLLIHTWSPDMILPYFTPVLIGNHILSGWWSNI